MDNRNTAAMLGVAGLLLLGAPANAHHGFASYSHDVVTVDATVTDFKFINPHVQIFFDISNADGATEHWQGELTAPNKLARAGWTKRTFEPGDTLKISGEVARNGGHSIRIREIITADGKSLPLFESVD